LGTTDLGFIYRPDVYRCGWLHPTPLGERLLPIAAGVAPALRAEYMLGPDTTLHADVVSACDQEEALELELRREDGTLIETTDIGITDTHYVLSIPISEDDEDFELTPEQQAEIDDMVAEMKAEGWKVPVAEETATDFPQYQVQVWLVDQYAVP
jgi:hypothetical protein